MPSEVHIVVHANSAERVSAIQLDLPTLFEADQAILALLFETLDRSFLESFGDLVEATRNWTEQQRVLVAEESVARNLLLHTFRTRFVAALDIEGFTVCSAYSTFPHAKFNFTALALLKSEIGSLFDLLDLVFCQNKAHICFSEYSLAVLRTPDLSVAVYVFTVSHSVKPLGEAVFMEAVIAA